MDCTHPEAVGGANADLLGLTTASKRQDKEVSNEGNGREQQDRISNCDNLSHSLSSVSIKLQHVTSTWKIMETHCVTLTCWKCIPEKMKRVRLSFIFYRYMDFILKD